MQPGQVSVWVPIIVGVIGLIGIVAGQFVNAWREDRRWKREQQREDIRWRQEREKEQAKFAHDSMIDWRDRRLSIYGDYLQAIDDLLDTGTKWPAMQYLAALRPPGEVNADTSDQWSERYRRLTRLAESVQLVCTKQVRDLVQSNPIADTSDQLHLYINSIRDGKKWNGEEPMKRVWPYRDHLIERMRNELGANPVNDQQT